MDFAVLGCSLDALDAGEKVAMKRAYISALKEGIVAEGLARDPYDLLAGPLSELPGVSVAGRLELESFLTPRPAPSDLERVDPGLYREFLDTGGCSAVAARLREFIDERVLPLRPLTVGVDHSLTGGALEALAASGAEPALVVLDTHLDAIPSDIRREALQSDDRASGESGTVPDSYNCGTWLAAVIDRGVVSPDRVVVLGPSDRPGEPATDEPRGMAAYRNAYLELEKKGVSVIGKKVLRDKGIRESIEGAIAGLDSEQVYISLDADVGSGEEVRSVRFLDTIGLTPDEVVRVGGELRRVLGAGGIQIVGLDIMEIDVHLADIPESSDRTVEMCVAFAHELLAGVNE